MESESVRTLSFWVGGCVEVAKYEMQKCRLSLEVVI